MAEPGGGRGGRAVAGERLVDHQTAVVTCTRRCSGRRCGEVAEMWFVVAAAANERRGVVE